MPMSRNVGGKTRDLGEKKHILYFGATVVCVHWSNLLCIMWSADQLGGGGGGGGRGGGGQRGGGVSSSY